MLLVFVLCIQLPVMAIYSIGIYWKIKKENCFNCKETLNKEEVIPTVSLVQRVYNALGEVQGHLKKYI